MNGTEIFNWQRRDYWLHCWYTPIIAATAIVNDLTLITRNVADFKHIDSLKVLNLWDDI